MTRERHRDRHRFVSNPRGNAERGERPRTTDGSPARWATRLSAAIAALGTALLFACNGDTPRLANAPVSIQLADYLEVARTQGGVGPLEALGATTSGGVRMAAGSRMIFHFALPDDAVLVGEGSASAPGGGPRGTRVHVAVTGEDNAPTHVFEERTAKSAGVGAVSFREDLSAFSGEMARLSVSFESDGPPGAREATLDWRVLRVEGTRIQPRASGVARDHYNVFLVVLDSLRQDHLEAYGATEM
jgi:hypothetical protein